MKKLITLGLCLGMLFSIVACASNNTNSSISKNTGSNETIDSSKDTKKAKFIGITTSMYTNEGLALMCDTIKSNLEAKGNKAAIMDANFDQAKQNSDIEDLINQKADLIIVEAADSIGVKPALEACRQAGVPVLSVSQILDKSIQDLPTGSITADNYQAGWDVGEEVAKEIGYKGTVGMITYDVAFVCRERGDGFFDAISQYKDIKILEKFDGICTEDDAMKKTEDWLQQYPDIDVIFGNNSNVGIGIAAAVSAAGKGEDILVANVDGLSGDIRSMKGGGIDVTAVYPMRELAEAASEAAFKVLETGSADEDPHLKFSLCTPKDVDKFMEYWGIK